MDQIANAQGLGAGALQKKQEGSVTDHSGMATVGITDERRTELERLERDAGVEHEGNTDESSRFPRESGTGRVGPDRIPAGDLPNLDIDKR